MRIKFVIGVILILLLPTGVDARDLTIISENNPPFNFIKNGRLSGSAMEPMIG